MTKLLQDVTTQTDIISCKYKDAHTQITLKMLKEFGTQTRTLENIKEQKLIPAEF